MSLTNRRSAVKAILSAAGASLTAPSVVLGQDFLLVSSASWYQFLRAAVSILSLD
jgi:hypothetical protein